MLSVTLVLKMKVLFSFDLYDQDNRLVIINHITNLYLVFYTTISFFSKVIDVSEVVAMLQDVYGTAFNSNKRAKE